MKFLTVMNNKGGVGKTTLVFHLAWMLAEKGYRVLVADLDPQANLTAHFLDNEQLAELWPDDAPHPRTIYGALARRATGEGDIQTVAPQSTARAGLWLLPGDLALTTWEGQLATSWFAAKAALGQAFEKTGFLDTTAIFRAISASADEALVDIVICDVGPNLGAVNRSVLLGTDFVLVPVAADLFSLLGLQNLGPTLLNWKREWSEMQPKKPVFDGVYPWPSGDMKPIGYVVQQHPVWGQKPVAAYERWANRIPVRFRDQMMAGRETLPLSDLSADPYRLALLKNYRSLVPLAQEARKPVFALKPADGVVGKNINVERAKQDYSLLADRVALECGLAKST